MAEAGSSTEWNAADASSSALVLLQAAAARAEIGPFARRGRASPQAAAGSYQATARLAAPAAGTRLQWARS
ncbi:hypothetical protein [Bosea sp. ANAM02]|uniref:hypothetical protein n=1 Tax=Bosea sp. ANAM02 TaxID=2020412 RepID=UPI00064910F8|nr:MULTISPECIES: hypothetical protein [Hyphomicrobiales]BCB18376.1 hypothetical protein OCUBac02_12700 [Bosea sp. ANAM02]